MSMTDEKHIRYPSPVKLGETVIRPIADTHELLEGTVIFIHETHRWYQVEFTLNNGAKIKESYNFYGHMA